MSTPFEDLPTEKLTFEQESELSKKIQKNKLDTKSINKLVMHNLREAVIYSRHVSRSELSDGVLISLLYRVMCLNAKRFKGKYGIRFFAFCKVGIRGAMKRHWTTMDVVRRAKTITRGQAILEREHAKPPRPSEHVEDEHITFINDIRVIDPAPLNDDEIEQPDFDGIFTRERWDMVKKVIDEVCSEREKMILNLAYMNGFNLKEVGEMMEPPVCREWIRQVHAQALRKVRCALMEKGRLLS